MSDRGTFTTSYLAYDAQLGPLLRDLLRGVSGKVHEVTCRFGDEVRTGSYSGMVGALYPGGECDRVQEWVRDTLGPALPPSHGRFSIVVLAEDGSTYTATFKNGTIVQEVRMEASAAGSARDW